MLEQSSSAINPYSGVIDEDATNRSTSQIGPQVSIAAEPALITREATEEKGKKKRFRKSYSCGNCRHRKIKCDRTFPCQPCKQRGIASQCGPTHCHKRNRESVVEEEQESNELEKKWKGREQEGVPGRYEQEQQQNPPHQRQQTHTHGRHRGIDRRLRRWSESCTEGGTSVASPSDMEQQRTPSRSALDSLYRTMESFQTQISQMELRVQSAQSQATSSSSAAGTITANDAHRRHRHSTTSAHVHHHINPSRHRTPHHHPPDKYEMVLAHMKTLELKLDLILKRLMHMNNQAASSVQIPAVPPLLSLAPFGQGEDPLPMSTLVQQQFNNNIGDAEFPLDQAIDRWLEQEGGLPPSGFHLDVEQQRQSDARSQTRGGHESMAHPPYSAPTAPLTHMDGYFTGSR